ncbi:Uncharacterised protein [BD1-7 clade bacterium]|nr:Uncharacterised protein [BD1-7 clade bacterium]
MKTLPKVSKPEQTRERYGIALLGAETGGSLNFRSQEILPNQGTPLHKHIEQDETFHVVTGSFRFIVGEEEIFASDGTTLFVPRGTPHSSLNIGDTSAKIISALTPGVHDGFILNIPEAEKAGATRSELSEMAASYGAVILGPKQNYKKG